MSPTRAVANVRWIAASQASRVGAQVVGVTVLARLLPPEDFGVMAMAAVVTNFASLVRDMGTGAALIQKQKLEEQTATSVFWLNIALGFAIATVIVALAPLVSLAFGRPELTAVLRLSAPMFLILGASTAQQALLERDGAFRCLARIEISSSFLALALAIACALRGFGVYSLVVQAVAAALLSSVQLWLASAWRPRLRFRAEELRSILRFSGNLTVFNFLNFLSRNADNVVVGGALGAVPLGIYSMAYKLMLFPVQNFTWVANRALFPVMSRQQSELAEMRALYLRVVRTVATMTAPLMAGLFVLREPFVQLVYGPRWQGVASLMAWLAPIGFLQSIVSTTGTVFMATGRTDLLLRLGVLGAVLQVTAFVLGARYGLVQVAAFYGVATLLGAVPTLVLVVRVLGGSLRQILAAIARPVGSAAIMALVILGSASLLPTAAAYWRQQLGLHILLGALSYATVLYWILRQNPRDVLALFGRRSSAL